MRVAVIGSGIAGLTAATLLADDGRFTVRVFESEPVIGGRANTVNGGEHCGRLFLSDYRTLLGVLGRIPGRDPDVSIAASLMPLRRLCHTDELGWVEISHLYPMLSRELSWRSKWSLFRQHRHTPILGEPARQLRRRKWGYARSLSPAGWYRVVHNMARRPVTYGFESSTDDSLIAPWTAHLRSRGVEISTSAPVDMVRPRSRGIDVRANGDESPFDGCIVATFLPQARTLLDGSGLPHRLPDRSNIAAKCMTLRVDKGEAALQRRGPVLLSGLGLTMVLQPGVNRVTALCTNFDNVPDSVMLERVVTLLDLRHPVESVAVRQNELSSEGLFCSNFVPADMALPGASPVLQLAGSYIRNGYPVDSGEGAARSAAQAVARLMRALGVAPPTVEQASGTPVRSGRPMRERRW